MDKHNDHEFDLAMEVGEIKGLLHGITKRLDTQNGALATVTAKVNKHDIIFGKIGLVVVAFGAFFSIAATITTSWIKEKFL